ncbi:DUF2065 domain-containing protein [Roseospirillum parvum]|uniref:DUF2065 domain-containing protein n=1 Tax=Roseospirillum parvum TaxID=83401 RepID=A0A1G7WY45_9PROT|nr:DUF2065 domain-containing protein [Roseospirillum parvum]SDG76862.1 hypothetical protein SAMN05421742_102363 [Roseospirillum parvum]
MSDHLWMALALVLVIEGLLYALLPETMQRMMRQVLEMPPETLRWAGLAAAATGVAAAWWLHG